ncbi:MAG: AAA family ATPase [Chloroflexota bacterium]|nr:AAA family ATPase [Chloroflexota bacterium]
MAEQEPSSQPEVAENAGITRITVAGFKSIAQEQSIEVRPLTILAGVNSSGKSSIMQPLLLLKQTLDATYDPGALLLNGPNVRFTSTEQILSRVNDGQSRKSFHVGAEISTGRAVKSYFTRDKNRRIDVEQTIYTSKNGEYAVYRGMPSSALNDAFIMEFKQGLFKRLLNELWTVLEKNITIDRNRCFLTFLDKKNEVFDFGVENTNVGEYIRQIIHLPDLRGNPERTYPITAVGPEFPGTFDKYFASVIGQWQSENNAEKLRKVNRDLARLGLTGGISAEPIDDTQIELLVHRYSRKEEFDFEDMVSIADVGLGISQTLPVIVALHTASPDQLIYVEQPELHLHPRAQSAMAEVLADAAIAGARMVVETHSSLLLLGIQTLVAEGKLPHELVKLHWFQLLDDGSTQIISADLDETGAFGDWPVDFADVALSSEGRYLDAAQARMLKGS